MRVRTFLIWLFGYIIGVNTLSIPCADSNDSRRNVIAKYMNKSNIDRIRTELAQVMREKFGTIGSTKYGSVPIGLIYDNGDIYPVPEQDIPPGRQEAVGVFFPEGIIYPIIDGLISHIHMRMPIGVLHQDKNIYPVSGRNESPCFDCKPEGVLYPDGIILDMPSGMSTSNSKVIAILNPDGTVTPVNQTELGFIPDLDKKYNIMQNIHGEDAIEDEPVPASDDSGEAEAILEYLLARQQLKEMTDKEARAKADAVTAAKKVANTTAALQIAEELMSECRQKLEIASKGGSAVPAKPTVAQVARRQAEEALAKATAILQSAEKLASADEKTVSGDEKVAEGDEKKQAKEEEKQTKEEEKQAKEEEKQAKEDDKKLQEEEKKLQEEEKKQAKEDEKQAKEAEKQAEEAEKKKSKV